VCCGRLVDGILKVGLSGGKSLLAKLAMLKALTVNFM
jgi:hypothetical protein